MNGLRHFALTWLGAAALVASGVACTNDFDQFEPDGASQGATGSGGATTGPGAGGGATTTGAGGMGGAGGAPACGDGTIGGSEQCDDGNLDSGDGCSSMCMLEGAETCPGTLILLTAAGLTLMGDTTGAANDHGQLPCGGSMSPELVYQIMPTQDGQLEATMTGSFSTLVYARGTCPGIENQTLACSGMSMPSTLSVGVVANEPLYLFADGRGMTPQQGAYTLTLTLTPN